MFSKRKHKVTERCEGCDYFKRKFSSAGEKLVCMLDHSCEEYATSNAKSFELWYERGYKVGYLEAKTEGRLKEIDKARKEIKMMGTNGDEG